MIGQMSVVARDMAKRLKHRRKRLSADRQLQP